MTYIFNVFMLRYDLFYFQATKLTHVICYAIGLSAYLKHTVNIKLRIFSY